MPIELDNTMEMNNDLLNCSEEILRKLDLAISSDENIEPSLMDEETVTTEKNGRKKKADVKMASSYLQIRLSEQDMQKARLIALALNCPVNSLFTEVISKHINKILKENRELIKNLTNKVLRD